MKKKTMNEISNDKIDEIMSILKSVKEIKDKEILKQCQILDEFAKVNSLLTIIETGRAETNKRRT